MSGKRDHKTRLPHHPHLELEQELWMDGFSLIAGIDESGRGAWAGPLVASAVILPFKMDDLKQALTGVDDSKQLSPRQRERLYPLINKVAIAVGIGIASPSEVDRHGLIPATRLAMVGAVENLVTPPQHLIIDAVDLRPILKMPQTSIFYADSLSLSVASASIIAKVTRDRIMRRIHHRYPIYGFAQHKGYGTIAHRAALEQHRPAPVHRKSFRPVAALIEQEASVS